MDTYSDLHIAGQALFSQDTEVSVDVVRGQAWDLIVGNGERKDLVDVVLREAIYTHLLRSFERGEIRDCKPEDDFFVRILDAAVKKYLSSEHWPLKDRERLGSVWSNHATVSDLLERQLA